MEARAIIEICIAAFAVLNAAGTWCVALYVRAIKAEFKAEILADARRQFVLTQACEARHEAIQKELDRLEGAKA